MYVPHDPPPTNPRMHARTHELLLLLLLLLQSSEVA
jgi:hypothetical protein